MSTPCSVCSHLEQAAIDELLRAGRTAKSVAVGYGLGYFAVARHRRNHLAGSPTARRSPGDPMDELIAHLRGRTLAGQDSAAREYRLLLTQQAARNATAPARGLVDEPEWQMLRARVLAALEDEPAARQKVADALVDF